MDPEPMQRPEFHNLEVSGSWDGEFEGPVRLRISLDVQSAPGTVLRLLDTKASAIFLKTASARLLSDESNGNSSLFAFSIPESDNLKGGRRFSAEKPPKSEEAFSASQDGPTLPSRSLMQDARMQRGTASAKLSDLCVNVAECEDLTYSPQLMKRSAADACFTNSTSDSDDAPTHKRLVSSNSTEKTLGSVEIIKEECIESGKLLGLEAWLETAAQPHEEKTADEVLPGAEKDGQCLEDQGTADSCKAAADDMPGTKEICGLSTPVTGSPKTPPRRESPITEGPYTLLEPPADAPCDQGDPSGLSALPELNLGTSEGQDTSDDEGMSTPDLSVFFSTAKSSNSNPGTWEKHYLIEETNEVDDDIAIQPLIEFSWSDPKLVLLNGDLIVKFSSNTRQATYRIDVNLTTYVDDDYIKGWSTILLPGLPRLQAGETGSFSFLIPQDRGFEFRTKHMQRCEVMEGCFFAGFTSAGSLVVPMRSCGRRFYGFLKDFVVDQEIVSHRAVENSEAGGDGLINYHAMCSLRLHQRFICSEKCGFSFYVNGAPDGFFICKLEHQKAGLQMIKLPRADSISTGLSRIQVICSPNDLGMFCLAWSIPASAHHWLPRIYSASPSLSKESRDHLRETFIQLNNRRLFEVPEEETKKPAHDGLQTEEAQMFDDKARIGPDNPNADHLETIDALLLFRLLMSALTTKILQLTKGYMMTALLFMSRLYHWVYSRMKHLTLAFVPACVLLVMSMWFFKKNADLGDSGFDQELFTYFGLGELYPGNHTTDAELSVYYYDSIFNEDHNILSGCSSISPGGIVEPSLVEECGNQIEKQEQEETTDGDHADTEELEDMEANLGESKAAEILSIRDRIDRWLGWKGPINRSV